MEIINSLENINSILNDLIKNDEYTSIGFIPVLNSITPADIIAIKKASKLLDVIVVQNISNERLELFSLQSLKKLSPNLVIDMLEDTSNDEMTFSIYIEKINSLNLLKCLIAVLPSSVFVSQDNFLPFKAVQIISDNFKDLFSLHNVETPSNLMSFIELETLEVLKEMDKLKEPISFDSISRHLKDSTVLNYHEYKTSQGKFISIKIKDKQSNTTGDLTYLSRN